MLPIFLILLLFVVIFVFMSRLALKFAGRRFGKAMSERLISAQYIIETGKAPPPWTRGMSTARPGGKQDRSRLLHRLDELIRSFSRAPVFEDEAARLLFLERLGKVRSAWETEDLGEVLSPIGALWPPPHDPDNTTATDGPSQLP